MKLRVLFVVDEMRYGGVSKVLCDLLSMFDYDSYQVDVLVLHPHGEMLRQLPPQVVLRTGTDFFRVVDLRLSDLIHKRELGNLARKLSLVFRMRTGLIGRAIRRERVKMDLPHYDVEIAFKEGFCTLFVAEGPAPRKINWIHSDYGVKNESKHHMNLLMNALERIDLNVAVSAVAACAYQKVFRLPHLPDVIPNVMKTDEILAASHPSFAGFDQNSMNIVTVGRLSKQKGYDRLIQVHFQLLEQGVRHHIYVIGSGEEEAVLRRQAAELGITETFIFLGYLPNPYPYIRAADLYVCSSRYEGYSISILEALVIGTPVLATNVSGAKEQLQGNRFGLVVDNSEEGLLNGLRMIITEPDCLQTYRHQLTYYEYDNDSIVKSIYERFNNHE